MIVRHLAKGFAVVSLLASAASPVVAQQVNLVNNGNFESGNLGFSSQYDFSPTANTTESQYTVDKNPLSWFHPFVSVGDHTSGAGNMFIGNGSPAAGTTVWQSQSIAITPDTSYFFESWAMNICCNAASSSGPNSPAKLEFSVIGSQSSTSLGIISTKLSPGEWQFLGSNWNSGNNTSVTLQLINQNTAVGGNDFALDDIYFGKVSSAPVATPEPTAILAMIGSLISGAFIRKQKIN